MNHRGESIRKKIDELYRSDSRRVFATLIRSLGDFDIAEEALHEAFAAALEQWPKEGVPKTPSAWLITVGRLRGIDTLRRRGRFDRVASELLLVSTQSWPPRPAFDSEESSDDRLHLLFACCRPELPKDSQVALILREVCGLKTEEIARAFLSRPSTIAQRIVRAKQKLREAKVRFEVPGPTELSERSSQVMQVIYLVFNEGYSASSGAARIRVDLCAEAIGLARLLTELLPTPEADGLLALLLLQDARREGRTTESGDIVLLAEQDRSLWDKEAIVEGTALVEGSLKSGGAGVYTIQAAIAAVYSGSIDGGAIDWDEIIALHDVLNRIAPSPVSQLARAIAIAERDGAVTALALVDALLKGGGLDGYLPAHAARGDLCRRLDNKDEAIASFRRALELAQQEPEQRYFRREIARLESQS